MLPDLSRQQKQPSNYEAVITPQNTNQDRFLPSPFMNWSLTILLAYFGARLLFFALTINPFVPPDEITHAGLSNIFSKTFLFPTNSPETWQFGLVTNTPWLYYWTMGKLLHLNIFGLSDLVFLRLFNIPFAFGTIWYVVRLFRLLSDNRLALLLLVAMMTNTAMFSLLSASVSYDNMTNMLAAMAIYFQFAFYRQRAGGLLVASLLCQLAGCLTKITFLPLVLVLNVLLLTCEWRQLPGLPAAAWRYFRLSPRRIGLGVMLLVAVGLNLQLYAGNYLHFGTLNPGMSEVLSQKAAMEHRLDARGIIFNQYKDGKISYMDALILTGEMNHPGDKADTFYLLMNYENLKKNPQLWLGPLAYIKVWFENMVATIFGIKSHLIMVKDWRYLTPLHAIMSLSLLGFIVRWRPHESGWLPPGLAAVAAFYAGYLLYEVNYPSYLNYGAPALTVYGRYLFPIIGVCYSLSVYYILALFRSEQIRIALALSMAVLFIAYDFPWFLMHATPEWFSWLPH
jgi:hypothetical protein